MTANDNPPGGRRNSGARIQSAELIRRAGVSKGSANAFTANNSRRIAIISEAIRATLASPESENFERVKAAENKWRPHIISLENMVAEKTLPDNWGTPDFTKAAASYLHILLLHAIETGTEPVRNWAPAQQNEFCRLALGISGSNNKAPSARKAFDGNNIPPPAIKAFSVLVGIDQGFPLQPRRTAQTRPGSRGSTFFPRR